MTGKKQYGRRSFASGRTLKMPTPDKPGWQGRISRGIIDIVQEIKKSDNPVKKLEEYGVKKADAEKLIDDLSEDRVKRIKDGLLDQSKTIRRFFLNSALRKTAVSLTAGETDEPVTCDTKRLIRLPDSLHGKTGFRVMKININDLGDFNPLNDAIALGDETVKIRLKQTFKIKMRQQNFDLEEGEQEVPLYLGVFLFGRALADIL